MWRPEPQRRECQQETETDQASGETRKHEEENFSRDLADERSLTLAGLETEAKPQSDRLPALRSSLLGARRLRKGDAMRGNRSRANCKDHFSSLCPG